jgi:hypothetical protein
MRTDVPHLERGDVEEPTSNMLIEDTLTEKQQSARLEAVFASESGSLKDWFGALRLDEYHDNLVEAGAKDLKALVKEEDLGAMGIP